jgi:glutamate formiminotransferase/formiminotetrahydrofolate cyclodeaminase
MNLTDLPLGNFLDQLGSASPAPGGGSIAALSGACAASLCAMVCRITLGKEKQAESWPNMRDALAEAESQRARLCALVQEDSDAFNAVVAARRLARGTEAERDVRTRVLQEATIHCAKVPLETLEMLGATASVVDRVFSSGDPACVTDAASAAAMTRSGARAAEYNVRINLPGILDETVRSELAARASRALSSILAVTARIEKDIDDRLQK